MQVCPTVRNQCSVAYAFQQNKKDAAELADMFNVDDFLGLPKLPMGSYMRAETFGRATIHKLFTPKKRMV